MLKIYCCIFVEVIAISFSETCIIFSSTRLLCLLNGSKRHICFIFYPTLLQIPVLRAFVWFSSAGVRKRWCPLTCGGNYHIIRWIGEWGCGYLWHSQTDESASLTTILRVDLVSACVVWLVRVRVGFSSDWLSVSDLLNWCETCCLTLKEWTFVCSLSRVHKVEVILWG